MQKAAMVNPDDGTVSISVRVVEKMFEDVVVGLFGRINCHAISWLDMYEQMYDDLSCEDTAIPDNQYKACYFAQKQRFLDNL